MASSSQKRLKSTDDVETFFKSFTSKNWLQVCIPVESVDKDKSEVTYQCPNTECKTKKKTNKPYTFTNKKNGYSNIKQHLKHCLPFVTLKTMLESAKSTHIPREEKILNLIKVIVLANMPIFIANNEHMREFGGMVDGNIVHSNTIRGVLSEMRLLVEEKISKELVSLLVCLLYDIVLLIITLIILLGIV